MAKRKKRQRIDAAAPTNRGSESAIETQKLKKKKKKKQQQQPKKTSTRLQPGPDSSQSWFVFTFGNQRVFMRFLIFLWGTIAMIGGIIGALDFAQLPLPIYILLPSATTTIGVAGIAARITLTAWRKAKNESKDLEESPDAH